jgi:aryl-alcohol dehydrogenase-like predicted oxidoreductase
MMEKRRLGRTGLEVTVLGYGAMQLRGAGVWNGPDISEDAAADVLNAVLDAGINLIDTARGYGLSEERIGRHISGRREEFVLATKSDCGGNWSGDGVRRDLETSLKLLDTDRVDVLQLHNPTPQEAREGGLVAALQKLRDEGMTRHIGISTFLPDVFEFIEWGEFETFQFPYSCIQQKHRQAMERAAAAGAGIIARGGVSWGGPHAAGAKNFVTALWGRAGLDEVLGEMPAAELLLRHTLAHPDCHTNIVGSTDPEHVRRNAAAAGRGALPEELQAEVSSRLEAAREAIRREKQADGGGD